MAKKNIQIVAILLIILSASCAKVPSRAIVRVDGTPTHRSVVLEGELKSRMKAAGSIKALAWMELDDGEEVRQTETALVIFRPNGIRVDATDQLADVWASAGSNGKNLWLFIPSKSKLYSGRASRSNLHRLAKFDWDISELISVIAGSPPTDNEPELLQIGNPRDGHFADRKSGLHIWTDGKSGLPIRCVKYGSDGATPDYDVSFSDFRKVGKLSFPYRIEAVFPGRDARIVVVYRDVGLGGDVDQKIFLPPKVRGGKIVDLKE